MLEVEENVRNTCGASKREAKHMTMEETAFDLEHQSGLPDVAIAFSSVFDAPLYNSVEGA